MSSVSLIRDINLWKTYSYFTSLVPIVGHFIDPCLRILFAKNQFRSFKPHHGISDFTHIFFSSNQPKYNLHVSTAWSRKRRLSCAAMPCHTKRTRWWPPTDRRRWRGICLASHHWPINFKWNRKWCCSPIQISGEKTSFPPDQRTTTTTKDNAQIYLCPSPNQGGHHL